MRQALLVLLWCIFISHQAAVCKAQDNAARLRADPYASMYKATWPRAAADGLVAPAGLIHQLPPDGTWARFEQNNAYVTIASVGKTVVAQQPCRWIEVILEVGGRDLVWKLLIPEDCLKGAPNILEHVLSMWHCTGREQAFNITGMNPGNEFGNLTFILTGPDQQVRSLGPQVVETKLGCFECAGWTGRQLTTSDEREVHATFRQWVHEKAPFGVLRSEIEYTIKFDGHVIQNKDSIALVEVGTGAVSRISTANRSIEELTAEPFAPAPGWRWAVWPESCNWASMATRGLAMAVDRKDQEFRLTLAYPWTPGGTKYRPVAFDVGQRRYEFEMKHDGASGTVGLIVLALDQNVLPTDKIKRVGIEKTKQEISEEPPSLIGKSLPSFSNLRFNSVPKHADERAILICFSDIDQRPSRSSITQLARQVEQIEQKGVIVVAVQTSRIDEDTLSEWGIKNNILFPVGVVQGDEQRIRFAWGVRSLPWLILTDREHIVRAEGFAISELNAKLEQIDGD